MGEFRESSAIIREAELLASSPETVAAWLKERSAKSAYDWTDGDQDTETTLAGMGSPLVDLALARYGRNPPVLRGLFARDDVALRAAVLSNEPHLREVMFDPWVFTGTPRHDFSWLSTLSDTEFQALFANPALPDSFMSDFFEQKGAWQFIEDKRRREAIHWLCRHLPVRERPDGYDGWADYSHSKVFDAAWRLSAEVPATPEWAGALAHLYDRLPPTAFSKFDPLELTKRWFPGEDDDQTWNDEESYKEKGYLTWYQRVRAGLARLAASAPVKAPRMDLLNDPDVAVRCGACAALKLDPDAMTEAVARDGSVAAHALIENEHAWRNAKAREALRKACWSVPDARSDMLVPQAFNQREATMRERYPRWFADGDQVEREVTEVSMPRDLELLRQQANKLQKMVEETRLLLLLGLAGAALAYFLR